MVFDGADQPLGMGIANTNADVPFRHAVSGISRQGGYCLFPLPLSRSAGDFHLSRAGWDASLQQMSASDEGGH